MRHMKIEARDPELPPLVLLHGSGGKEVDMLAFAQAIAPDAAAISLRGAIKWEQGYAFFRRFPDRTVDEADLRCQADRLAAEITGLVRASSFARRPFLIGFSNGAIMVAALLLLHPALADKVALIRPLSPFATPPGTDLSDKSVLILEAGQDERRQAADGQTMARQLLQAGATVTHHRLPGGHQPNGQDFTLLHEWYNLQQQLI